MTQYNYEIIAVGNDVSPPSRQLVTEFERVRFEHEGRPGSYCARNRGIKVARGRVLAFTDADCIPQLNWLEMGVKHLLKTEAIQAVGGEITLFVSPSEKPNAAALYERVFGFDQERFVKNLGFAATANFFVYRGILEKVGEFKSSLKSGGDLEFGKRLKQNGHCISFCKEAIVLHPPRRTLRAVLIKAARIRGGQLQLMKQGFSNKDFGIATRTFVDVFFPRQHIRLIATTELLDGLSQRSSVYFTRCLVNLTTLLENIRIRLGGAPFR